MVTGTGFVLGIHEYHLRENDYRFDKQEFDEILATKIESAPGPDGIPCGIYRCAGGLGSRFLFNAYKSVVEGGSVPTHFAASRTVFIPKSSTVDDNGLIVRSLDALRPLNLSISDCICFGVDVSLPDK